VDDVGGSVAIASACGEELMGRDFASRQWVAVLKIKHVTELDQGCDVEYRMLVAFLRKMVVG
jgi:hypothetical protein